MESIEEIFDFWHEKGFTDDIEDVVFFLTYISETQNISQAQLKKLLEKSKIDGGEIMQTLAQRLRKEGEKQGKKQGVKEEKIRTAKELIKRGVAADIIAEATALPLKEIEKLGEKSH
jgi:predicted transposase/invertase (TIGR01784 family)